MKARITDQMRCLLANSVKQPNDLPASSPIAREWRPIGVLEVTAVALMIVAVIFGLVRPIDPFFSQPPWLWAPLHDFLAKLSPWTGSIAAISLIVLFTPSAGVYALRSSDTYKKALSELRLRYAPIFFAITFCVIAVLFASHYIFNIVDSFGGFCRSTLIDNKALTAATGRIGDICYEKDVRNCPIDASAVDPNAGACHIAEADPAKCTGKAFLMDTRDLCVSTGIFVESSNRYHLFVSKYEPAADARFSPAALKWRFAWTDSDPGGKTISQLGEYDDKSCGPLEGWRWLGIAACNYGAAFSRQLFGIAVYPLKRTFDRPLGTFVLRYGPIGNEENLIDPAVPPAEGGRLHEVFKPTSNGELFAYLNKPELVMWPNAAYNLNSGIAKVTIIRVPPKN